MTTAEYEYALDLRVRTARGETVRPRTVREAAVAVGHGWDEEQPVALDLSALKRIVIDPRARTARVQAGVTAAELAAATETWGLAPLVDHRGGLVEANLLAAQVVLPDGQLVAADEALLREIRTGHAVGIVVDATYRLHPSGELGR